MLIPVSCCASLTSSRKAFFVCEQRKIKLLLNFQILNGWKCTFKCSNNIKNYNEYWVNYNYIFNWYHLAHFWMNLFYIHYCINFLNIHVLDLAKTQNLLLVDSVYTRCWSQSTCITCNKFKCNNFTWQSHENVILKLHEMKLNGLHVISSYIHVITQHKINAFSCM